jgi:hypothetical protein
MQYSYVISKWLGSSNFARKLNAKLIKRFSFFVASYLIYCSLLDSKGMTFLRSQRTLVLFGTGSNIWVSFWSCSVDVAFLPTTIPWQKPNNEILDGPFSAANGNQESCTTQSSQVSLCCWNSSFDCRSSLSALLMCYYEKVDRSLQLPCGELHFNDIYTFVFYMAPLNCVSCKNLKLQSQSSETKFIFSQ